MAGGGGAGCGQGRSPLRRHVPDGVTGAGPSWGLTSSSWRTASARAPGNYDSAGYSVSFSKTHTRILRFLEKQTVELQEMLLKSGHVRRKRKSQHTLNRRFSVGWQCSCRRPGHPRGRRAEPDGTGGQNDRTRSPFRHLARPYIGQQQRSCYLNPNNTGHSFPHTEPTGTAATVHADAPFCFG